MPPTPTLLSAFADASGAAALSFGWTPFGSADGTVAAASYSAGLYADAGLSAPLVGGGPLSAPASASPSATFSGVPAGSPFLLSVTALGAGGSALQSATLLGVASVGGVLPGSAGYPGDAPAPAPQGDPAGVLCPLRRVYGTVDGVKRWARMVGFGDAPGQATDLDALYFLMVACDDADGLLCARYAVPLTQYRDALGQWRYPPPLPGLMERKAAGLLLYARKAALTETEGGTAVGLMGYADKQVALLAAGTSLLGQTLTTSMLPQVTNPVPRQFSMPGDPVGREWNPVVGSSDVRFLRQHSLNFYNAGWRFGGGAGAGYEVGG